MDKEDTKPFGFRAPVDLAIEVKVSAVRKQQHVSDWLMDAARLKLRLERDRSTQAA